MRNSTFSLIFLFIFILIIGYGIYFHINNLPNISDPDGLQHLSFDLIIYDAFHRFKEYPLWNPYLGGGIPWAGYFQNPGLSFLSIFPLLFGEIVGLKLKLLCYLFLGGYSINQLFIVWMRLPQKAALFGSCLYLSSPWFAGKILDGNYSEIGYFIFPVYIILFLSILKRKWQGIIFPFLIMNSLAIEHYRIVFYLAALLLLLTLNTNFLAGNNSYKIIKTLLVTSIVGFFLTSHKIFSMLQELKLNLVDFEIYKAQFGYTWKEILKEIFLLQNTSFSQPPRWHYGIGFLGAFLAFIGFFKKHKQYKGITTLLFISIFLSMGENSPLPLSQIISKTPLISSIRDYAKYFNYFIMFSLCSFAAIGFKKTQQILKKNIFINTLFIFTLIQPAKVTFIFLNNSFKQASYDLVSINRSSSFYHMVFQPYENKIEKYRLVSPKDYNLNQYFNIKNNIGTISWYGGIVYSENARAKHIFFDKNNNILNSTYKGMIYGEFGGYSSDLNFTYNTMRFYFNGNKNSLAVINFNYHPYWKSNIGNVENKNGLLSVRLEDSYKGEIRLQYVDPYFSLGVCVMILTAVIWCFYYKCYILSKKWS